MRHRTCSLAGRGAAQKIEIEPPLASPSQCSHAILVEVRFTRHVDNPPEAADLRVVTAILYLNGDWQPAHGGALRMYGVGSPAISTDADSSEPFVEVEHPPRHASHLLVSFDPSRGVAGLGRALRYLSLDER